MVTSGLPDAEKCFFTRGEEEQESQTEGMRLSPDLTLIDYKNYESEF